MGTWRHELFLGLPGSEWAEPEFNSLEYDKLRGAVLDSAAATKIIILDCCFSGRVVSEAMADPVTEMVGQIEIDGTYVLASARRDQVALILPGENHTAFTGRLLHLLRNGVPEGPELLTIDYLYQQLVIRMRAEGLSQPQMRGTSTAGLLALAGNRAYQAGRQNLEKTAQRFAHDAHLLDTGTTAHTPTRPVSHINPVPVPSSNLALTLTGHSEGVRGTAFSPDRSLLVTASDDHTARVWDTDTGYCLRTLTGHSAVNWVAVSPDGHLLATAGGGDGTVQLWDMDTGYCLRTLTGHDGWVSGVAFSPDGRLLASGGRDETVRLWDPVTDNCLRTLTGHDGWVGGVAFSPDGWLLASGGAAVDDNTVRVWDHSTGNCLHTLRGHTEMVWGVAFSPDGWLLASGGRDAKVRLWDPVTGNCLRTLTGHDGWVGSVAFSPDGRLLASGGEDKTARLWN